MFILRKKVFIHIRVAYILFSLMIMITCIPMSTRYEKVPSIHSVQFVVFPPSLSVKFGRVGGSHEGYSITVVPMSCRLSSLWRTEA